MFKLWIVPAAALIALGGGGYAEKTERFDRDPGWEAHNNRPTSPTREIKQDFGYSRTAHAGGKAGEMGGFITPSAEPAYYAGNLGSATLDEPLTASGTLNIPDGAAHLLLGFFNHNTIKEWRTPNTIAIRLSGRGEYFHAWLEYCTSKWRAGGDSPKGFTALNPATGRQDMLRIPAGKPYRWTLRYDPKANNGAGAVSATIGEHTALCNLEPEHRKDGATITRFGMLNLVKHADSGGNIWIDDVTVQGTREDFRRDPRWDFKNNRSTYQTADIRPRFDFGFSPTTRHAGGAKAGELGGMLFRGDGRYPDKMALFADRLPAVLDLKQPLRISGKVAMRRGITDSTVLLGFFNRERSPRIDPAQDTGFPYDFFGVAIEGPSSEGFLVYPCYRVPDGSRADPRACLANRIYPDGKSHTFSLDYDPAQQKVTVKLDGGSGSLAVPMPDREAGLTFDRFGIVTTRIDGNGQHVFWDDLTYTVRQ